MPEWIAESLPDWLAKEFMQRALFAGLLVSLLASYLGVFVVQRGMSFLGSGLAHAAFGGVALGLLLNQNPLWVALPFTVMVAIAITWVRQRTQISADTSIGIFFSVSFALGVVLINQLDSYTTDAMTYLFGSILYVEPIDLWMALVVLVICIALGPLWPRWAYATFDRELARADRVPVEQDDYLLHALVAVVIVVAVKLVGIVMVAAFLVIPPAAARVISFTFIGMTVMTMVLGSFSAMVGLRAAYELNLPPGATIILTQAAIFLLAMVIAPLIRQRSSTTRPTKKQV
jgi:zinc transport system permease protein